VEEKGTAVPHFETHVQLNDPWKRSWLRARRRRAEAARLRRRRFRARSTKSSLVAAALVTAVVGGGVAVGHSTGGSAARSGSAQSSYGYSASAVQRALGIQVTGVYDAATQSAVLEFQRRNGLLVDGIVGPQTAGALGISPSTGGGNTQGAASEGNGAASTAAGAPSATLASIARCESGGNPRAVGGGGRYRGKYQFSRETWAALGGTGDPAAASEAEQDQRAAQLLRESGTAPWPNCA
jgi:hypothetical protein